MNGAILRNVDLSGAILDTADLTGADLKEANFQDASLISVDVTDANIEEAQIDGQQLRYTFVRRPIEPNKGPSDWPTYERLTTVIGPEDYAGTWWSRDRDA